MVTRSFFSVSANGVLAYRGIGGGADQQFTWYDRQGHTLGRAGEPGNYLDVALSPDGSRVASNPPTPTVDPEIWIYDPARNIRTRFTFLPQEGARAPAWSPDGGYLAFSSMRGDGIYIKNVSSSGSAEPVFRAETRTFVDGWSPDGRFLIFTQATRSYGLLALSNPLGGGERKAIPIAASTFSEMNGQVSPDSRWIVYAGNESGRFEIYVRPFPPGDGRQSTAQVSSSGGQHPRWRADGKELFYLAPDRSVMAVDVRLQPEFQSGTSHKLFQAPSFISTAVTLWPYDVTRDGQRFLLITPVPGAAPSPPL